MDRIPSYILLFAVAVLFQVFFFDNLTVSVYLSPLVYVAFIFLLPMETPPVAMLFLGLLTGMTIDWADGGAGIHTAVMLFSAFTRNAVLGITVGKENVREGGVPSLRRLGRGPFLRYLILFVALHHALFFLLESLSVAQLPHTLLRWLLSGSVTAGFVWLAALLFTSRYSLRL